MESGPVADIDSHGLLGVRHGESHELRFPHLGPVALRGHRVPSKVRRELDIQEREVPLPPPAAPVVDQDRKQPPVLEGPPYVGLPLVPDDPADAIGSERPHHGFEQLTRTGVRRPIPHRVPNIRVAPESRQAGPFLHAATVHSALDQADGNAQRLLEVPTEEVGRPGERPDGLRRARKPTVHDLLRGHRGRRVVHSEEPHVGMGGAGNLLAAVAAELHGQAHVRLPRTQPHLADHHIVHRDAVAPGDGEFEGATRLHGGQRDPPTAA